MPHDPYPRALGAVSLQEVQSAAVEHALLDRVLFSRGAHGQLPELVRQDESADRGADGEEQRGVGEYEERVLGGAVDALAVVRVVFDEREEEDLDEREQRRLSIKWFRSGGGGCRRFSNFWALCDATDDRHVKKGAYHYGRDLVRC